MRILIKIIRITLGIWRFKKYTNKTIDKLFYGFSEQATIDLENIINHSKFKSKDKSQAALSLAWRNVSFDNFQKAYDFLIIARKYYPNISKEDVFHPMELNCLFELGKYDEAGIIIDHLSKINPNLIYLKTAKSNLPKNSECAERHKLDSINEIYHEHDIATIIKSNDDLPLQLDNLTILNTNCSIPRNQQAKISIIIPAYSAIKTLHIAVNSLRNQTWENIEIIIVDDCSPDETLVSAKKLAAQDPRIKVYQTPKNSGSYTARNLALQHATGEFITVHDADDWSHPQKLEKQICHLIDNPSVIANISFWIKCSFQLEFWISSKLHQNYSSLMLKRNTLLEMGGWDEVRIEADAEIVRRIKGRFGRMSIHNVLNDVPLAFGLILPDSLTQNPNTHIRTQKHGVRRIYIHASHYYYKFHAKKNHWKIKMPNQQRAFPVPRSILPDIPQATKYDLVLIMDYCLRDDSYASTMDHIKAALASKLRVAILHWRRYDLNPKSKLNLEIFHMIHEGVVDLICPGDEVYTNAVIVGHPAILQYVIDLTPKIYSERFAIIANQMPARRYNRIGIKYDPEIVSANVQRLFGVKPVWIPISNILGNLMMKDKRFELIYHETWTPLTDVKIWCQSEAK
jgi:glycosyltransferase involved in cell wall biosynthesis